MQEEKDNRLARLIIKIGVVINNAVKGYALDVSIGGMYIYAPIQYPVGTVIALKFDLEPGDPQVSTKARVQYVAQGVGMGVKFFNISIADAERLKKFIDKNLQEHPEGTSGGDPDKRKKILVIDDVVTTRMMFKNRLIFMGYIVREAGNGFEAIKAIEKEMPDLILLDIVMPVMDGLKFLQVLRANEQMRDIKVVVVSVMSDPHTIEKASAYSVLNFFEKATTAPKKICDLVKDILG